MNNIQDGICNKVSTLSIKVKTIAKKTEADQETSKLKREVISRKQNESDYFILHGAIFKGGLVLIPKKIFDEILRELHQTHMSIVKMKQLSRKYCC